jgi:arylsulfatase A-like enzyme
MTRIGLVVAFFTVLGVAHSTRAAERPNIVVVVADDMGWRDTGYQGNPDVKTPHLDKLAAQGVRFDYFYASQQMCSPGRFSIMTGRNPFRTGLHQLGTMRPQEITLPEALKTAGYQTGHFGKWHLGKGASSPIGQGFDEAIWKLNFFDLGATLQVGDTKEEVPLEGDTSVATMNLALKFIDKQSTAKQPFFVQVCFGSPHDPHVAAPEFKSLYPNLPEKRQNFLGEVSGLDAAVGNLRQELQRLGIAENTIVWFTSDNGGITPQSQDPSGKGKQSVGARTVACLEWPARIKQPLQTSFPCGQWDMYPTLLEIVGVKMPDQPPLDGISLLPLLEGKMKERPQGMGFMQRTPNEEKRNREKGRPGDGLATTDFVKEVRGVWIDGKYKLVVLPTDDGGEPTVSLYDIYADPAHQTNLAAEHPEVVVKMRKDLDAWRTSVRASYDGKDFKDVPVDEKSPKAKRAAKKKEAEAKSQP